MFNLLPLLIGLTMDTERAEQVIGEGWRRG